MKRKDVSLFLIVLAIFALFASSCSDTGNVSGSTFDDSDCVYFEGLRLNCRTGNITNLCQDPLCTHDAKSGCVFYGWTRSTLYAVADGKIFFRKAKLYFDENGELLDKVSYQLIAYDIAGQKASVVLDEEKTSQTKNISEVHDLIFDKAEDKLYVVLRNISITDNVIHSSLYQLNTDTCEMTELMKIEDGYDVLSIKNGDFCFINNAVGEVYRKNPGDAEKTVIDLYEGGSMLEEDGNIYYREDGCIYKAKPGKIDPVKLVENISGKHVYHDGYLYYSHPVSGNQINDGNLYRISTTDENAKEEIFFDCGGENYNLLTIYTQFANEFLAVPFVKYTLTDSGEAEYDGNSYILILNTETGESSIVEYTSPSLA